MSYEYLQAWRQKNPERHNTHKRNYYAKSRKNVCGQRKHWTKKDESLVLTFEGTDAELSKEIGRSVQAIQIKRHRLQ